MKQVRQALNYIQTAYSNGLVHYPRVDNTLIFEKGYDLFPHPELNKINSKFQPLSFNKYKINKKSSLLFLSLTRVLTPGNIQKIAEFVDLMFDEQLNIKADQVLYAKQIQSLQAEFFKNKEISSNQLSEFNNAVYEDIQNDQISLYGVEDVYFISQHKHVLTSLLKIEHSENKKNVSQKKVKKINLHSIDEAISMWQSENELDHENILEDSVEFLGLKK